jgi:predicted nucleic acid-binding protein
VSRIFWDTMLFAYLLEDHPVFASQVEMLLARSRKRGDQLITSYLALGELMSGGQYKDSVVQSIIDAIREMGFECVEFNAACVEPFRLCRARFRLRSADAMHLACASAANCDLFLTGDEELLRKALHVPGVHFISSFQNAPL